MYPTVYGRICGEKAKMEAKNKQKQKTKALIGLGLPRNRR
jgi:hypothetical protein